MAILTALEVGQLLMDAGWNGPVEDLAVLIAIPGCESGYDTTATNPLCPTAPCYGLWQQNEGLGTALYDPPTAAAHALATYQASAWAYWGCGPDYTSGYLAYYDDALAAAKSLVGAPTPGGGGGGVGGFSSPLAIPNKRFEAVPYRRALAAIETWASGFPAAAALVLPRKEFSSEAHRLNMLTIELWTRQVTLNPVGEGGAPIVSLPFKAFEEKAYQRSLATLEEWSQGSTDAVVPDPGPGPGPPPPPPGPPPPGTDRLTWYAVAHALWRVADHYNHVHLDYNPQAVGTPICAGGSGGWSSPGSPRVVAMHAALGPYADSGAPFGISFSAVSYGGRNPYWLGTFSCRYIAGTTVWSQHAGWNAEDVGVSSLGMGDAVMEWLRAAAP